MSSKQERTALAFIAAFSTLDPQDFTSLCTPDCTHHFLPTSMNMSPLSTLAFATHISNLSQVLHSFPVTPKAIIHDEARNKVIIHATSMTDFWEDVMDSGVAREEWRYTGEYVFMFDFEEEEDEEEVVKISKVVEFVDSAGTERLRGLMKRARENRAKKEAEKAAEVE